MNALFLLNANAILQKFCFIV